MASIRAVRTLLFTVYQSNYYIVIIQCMSLVCPHFGWARLKDPIKPLFTGDTIKSSVFSSRAH